MKQLLMSINLYHQYFNNAQMKGVRVQADKLTQGFLDHYGLVVQQTSNNFSLYYMGLATYHDFCQSLIELLEHKPLRFLLVGNTQQFTIISDLPLDWVGMLLFSSQHQQNNQLDFTLGNDLSANEQPGQIGIIDIFPQDLIDAHGNNVNNHFSINIAARKTQWHYYLFNPNDITLEKPMVKNLMGDDFELAKPVTLSNGDNALLFSSGHKEYSLSESTEKIFNLVNEVASSFNNQLSNKNETPIVRSKPLITGLPVPSIDQLNIHMENGKAQAVSEMYIYL